MPTLLNVTKRLLAMIVAQLLLFSAPAYSEYIPVYDHFDDGTLDPAWSVSFENATGWTYEESGTELTVTDIASGPEEKNVVSLSQSFSHMTDFYIDFAFSWDSLGSTNAYGNVYLTLYDASHSVIAFGGYQDPWRDSAGQQVLVIGAEHGYHGATYQDPSYYYETGPYSFPLEGSASIHMSRTGDNIDLYWDDMLLVENTDSRALAGIDIGFWYYECGTYFGTEAVDFIRVADTPAAPIPEPSTLLLLGTGLVGLVGFRKKLKN